MNSLARLVLERTTTSLGPLTRRNHVYTQPHLFFHIPQDRILGAEYAKGITKQEVCVATDGSRYPDGGVGGAARAHIPGGTIIMQEYLGRANGHLSVEGEILGATLGLKVLQMLPGLTQATILVDCQQAIQEIFSIAPKHAALIRRFRDEAQSMRHIDQIRIAWVPAHEGVEMNELVDGDAKKAARGESLTTLISTGFQLRL
ncbi:ribonuclease H-like domain-containing protein [Mycena vitilis]|nr:ribonuclease H-like domain-containing protein [Mycena vitilis]